MATAAPTAAPIAAPTPVLLSTTPRNWTYKELITDLLQSEDDLVYWLQRKGLLASTRDCMHQVHFKLLNGGEERCDGVAVSSQRLSGCDQPS